MKKILFLNVLFLITLSSYSQKTFTKSISWDFSPGKEGKWSGNDKTDVTYTVNSVDGILQVDVNKVKYTWSFL